ncbi:MAG TPA: 16S rRNA (cytidine(1402)-2'-O)-methyltransferase [Patescibacteria group bacterium]|nr:16S rRNA (cytidine(1402)-2'-O)-methyltransferase [Patescibacteria group bacterium]
MLYLVATPIGNLEDITFRALNTLFSLNAILCEDTRKTAALLKRHEKPGLKIPELISFYEENELKRMPEAINRLKAGEDLALVTNSGTPTISDPGFKLVRECWREKIKVVPIPGPSSPIAALSASGLPTDKFLFLGFLPNKSGQRIKLFREVEEALKHISATIIFFESPFRIQKSLQDLQNVFGDIEIVIARELTKIHEELIREKVSLLIEKYSKQIPKGEFVVLFNTKI